MPVWLSVVSCVVGVIGTVGGFLGLTAYSGERARYKAKKRNEEEEKVVIAVEAQKQEELVSKIKKVVTEIIEPVEKDIAEIKNDLNQNKKATIASLRATMKELRDKYLAQGFADAGDKATWKELYDDYKDMGGNHFREWVNQWKEDVESLPKEKKVATKKRLVENKK